MEIVTLPQSHLPLITSYLASRPLCLKGRVYNVLPLYQGMAPSRYNA
jgi:hypothetical protein